MANKNVVGSIRPSQLLWTYGPGALVDLPNLSVVTMGLDNWDIARCRPVDEARLLTAVRRKHPSVSRLYIPPIVEDENVDLFSAEAKVGVPVRSFPRWLRCVRCQTLAEVDLGLFKTKINPYRPEKAHYIHTNCEHGKKSPSPAVPARFMLACREGHLDDFPWHWFVHDGQSDCNGMLKFVEQGASLQTDNLWVTCTCGMKKSMAKAFGKSAEENLPACRGRHPHINRYDDSCTENPRAVLLGASNTWFPVSISVLAIPMEDTLEQLITDGWEYFEDVESEIEVGIIVKTLKKTNVLSGIEKYDKSEIWKVLEAKRNGETQEFATDEDIKRPEWKVLTAPNPPTDWPHFLAKDAGKPKGYEELFSGVLQLERLREVNALIGFTRVEAPEESDDEDERPPMAPLNYNGKPEWVPASEVHGEGIFLRFDEDMVKRWEKKAAITERDEIMENGHRGWRNARKLDPEKNYPGSRYTMIHTFAHLLIRELALECGYNSASIRERIYADEEMAGVLIYTAAADSDGTLGGLVELGESETLGRLIDQSLERARVCASDPLCSEHEPSDDRSLHAAACHACTFVSETSCEKGNRYLDRAFIVQTFKTSDTAFFEKSRT